MQLDIQILGHAFLESFVGIVLSSSSTERCFGEVRDNCDFFHIYKRLIFFLSCPKDSFFSSEVQKVGTDCPVFPLGS